MAQGRLTLHQYHVLRILRGARSVPLARSQIAERTFEIVPELGELLGELAARGLLRTDRGEHSADVYSITVAGTELLASLDEPVAAADRAALSGLSPDEARGLVAALERIRGDA